MQKTEVAIIGGGTIGLSLAWRLAQAGKKVTVLEAGEPFKEASYAAAGMLAPQYECQTAGAFFDLCLASRRLYPSFLSELEKASGLPVYYRDEGTLLPVFSLEDKLSFQNKFSWQTAAGLSVEWLDVGQARGLEKELNPRISGAFLLRDDFQTDNRQLGIALLTAAYKTGVKILQGMQVTEVLHQYRRVCGLRVNGEVLQADIVVNAAGSWSGQIFMGEGLCLPVKPVKGQMLSLQAPVGFSLSYVAHGTQCYVVPRQAGRLVVGSTLESAGYDKKVTTEAVARLLSGAIQLFPKLSEAGISETWAGLRPETPDHLPVLGRTDIEGLFIASGHYRNGILLTPITAQLISQLILTGRTDFALQPFSLSRFENLVVG